MEAELKQLIEELALFIHAAVDKGPAVERARQKLRAAGYECSIVLDAQISVKRLASVDSPPQADTDDLAGAAELQELLGLSPDDLPAIEDDGKS